MQQLRRCTAVKLLVRIDDILHAFFRLVLYPTGYSDLNELRQRVFSLEQLLKQATPIYNNLKRLVRLPHNIAQTIASESADNTTSLNKSTSITYTKF